MTPEQLAEGRRVHFVAVQSPFRASEEDVANWFAAHGSELLDLAERTVSAEARVKEWGRLLDEARAERDDWKRDFEVDRSRWGGLLKVSGGKTETVAKALRKSIRREFALKAAARALLDKIALSTGSMSPQEKILEELL